MYRFAVSASAIILTVLIDSVYTRPGGYSTRYHSGQTLLTLLQVASFLSHQVVPFIFVASVRLIIIFVTGKLTVKERTLLSLRFARIMFLLFAGYTLITGYGVIEAIPLIIFLTGEFTDRVLFYADFDPENIENTINKSIKS